MLSRGSHSHQCRPAGLLAADVQALSGAIYMQVAHGWAPCLEQSRSFRGPPMHRHACGRADQLIVVVMCLRRAGAHQVDCRQTGSFAGLGWKPDGPSTAVMDAHSECRSRHTCVYTRSGSADVVYPASYACPSDGLSTCTGLLVNIFCAITPHYTPSVDRVGVCLRQLL